MKLTSDDVLSFEKCGYMVLDGVMPKELSEQLKETVNAIESKSVHISASVNYFKDLLFSPWIHDICSLIFQARSYSLHHLHAACHREGMPSLGWHHDYESLNKQDRSFPMIHIFFYLNGMRNEIGELLVVPGSHLQGHGRYEFAGEPFDRFPGVKSISRLRSGSIVVVNSALLHARRSLPGGALHPRYFIDASFCDHRGSWIPYLEGGDWKKILSELALYDRINSGGEFQFLFNKRCFSPRIRDTVLDGLHLRSALNSLRAKFSPSKVKVGR